MSTVLEGAISIRAALESGSRKITRLYVRKDKHDREVDRLISDVQRAQIEVRRVDREEVDAHAFGKTHGGVIAFAGARRYLALLDLVRGKQNPLIVMVDGLEDPYNFGHAVRALYSAGVGGLVIRDRDWSAVEGTIARASAGASERMPTAVAATALDAAGACRELGLLVACAARGRTAVSLFKANLTRPLFIVIGGEKRGISRQLVENADLLIEVPYGRQWRASLGLTEAASVIGFEALRQRSRE